MPEGPFMEGVINVLVKTPFGQFIIFLFILQSLFRFLSSFFVLRIIDPSEQPSPVKTDLDLSLEELLEKFKGFESQADRNKVRDFQIFLYEKKIQVAQAEAEILSQIIEEIKREDNE